MPAMLSRNMAAHRCHKQKALRSQSLGNNPLLVSQRDSRTANDQLRLPKTESATSGLVGLRAKLRHDVHHHVESLTTGEKHFLEALSINGDDKSVWVASERLRNTHLFFDPRRLDEGSNRRNVASNALETPPKPPKRKILIPGRSRTNSLGLQRRQSRVHERPGESHSDVEDATGQDINKGNQSYLGTLNRDPKAKHTKHVRRSTAPSFPTASPCFLPRGRLWSDGTNTWTSQDFIESTAQEVPAGCDPSVLESSRKVPSQLLLQDTRRFPLSWRVDDDDADDDASWKLDKDETLDHYDPWMAVEDEYVNGYGGGGTLPFVILGTFSQDEAANPHVLSPPLMESLREFIPVSCSEENFWMKYSLIRDGASLSTFLQRARGSHHTLIALETMQGEVFGAFVSERWHCDSKYYGNMNATFLWRMRRSRQEKWHSIVQQAHMESIIDVFPATGDDDALQFCNEIRMVVGGGHCDVACGSGITSRDGQPIQDHEWGLGLTIESNLLYGTTSPCLTFGSPSLSNVHPLGSKFEIVNLELWTLTPCFNEENANNLECSRLFLEERT